MYIDYESKPGFRLRYEDNPCEEMLRQSLGMSEGDSWDADQVRSYLESKLEAALAQEDEEVPPDWAELRQLRKEQRVEREKNRKQKEKAIKRDTSHRARQKLLESGE